MIEVLLSVKYGEKKPHQESDLVYVFLLPYFLLLSLCNPFPRDCIYKLLFIAYYSNIIICIYKKALHHIQFLTT